MRAQSRFRPLTLLSLFVIPVLLSPVVPPVAPPAGAAAGVEVTNGAFPVNATQPALVVQPDALEATLAPEEMITQTLWITNAGDAVLTFTLSEYTRTIQVGPVPHPDRPRSIPVVDAQLQDQLQAAGQARAIIYLRELPDLSGAYAIREWAARGRYVYNQLQQTAQRSGGALQALLEKAGAAPRVLLTANAIAATVDAPLLDQIAARPEVASISPNTAGSAIPLTTEQRTAGSAIPLTTEQRTAALETVEWNIAQIRADQVWSVLGITGTGAVIGEIDTGVAYTHTALVNQYRGNLGGGNWDHNYNWYDATGAYPSAPNDGHGHGTMGMGLAVGDDGAGNQIGVAPGAKWIAFKALDDSGSATLENLHAGLQWMLAPTDLTGANPRPDLRPQVGLNMWRWFTNCSGEFEPDLQTWRAAGMLPVFAPGSEGPGCGLVSSPADSPAAFSAGATDNNDNISGFSARGPSCYDEIKPDAAAPGINVRCSYLGNTYTTVSGTSFSTAHLAGAAALVYSANPTLDGAAIENMITSTTLCRTDTYCGGTACHNNAYGWGRIDAFAAVSRTIGYVPPVDVPWLGENPVTGTLSPGQGTTVDVTFNATGLADGVYRAGLRVASNDPLLPEVAVPVTMTVVSCDPPSSVDFGWQPPSPIDGQLLTLTASATGTAPLDFAWDLGDGNNGAGSEIVHSYTAPGDYTVVLTATNCSGVAVTAVHTITVSSSCVPIQQADFYWTPQLPESGQFVSLTAWVNMDWLTETIGLARANNEEMVLDSAGWPRLSYTGIMDGWVYYTPYDGSSWQTPPTLPITYTWDLGDGAVASGAAISHIYSQPGDYPVTLTATNCAGPYVVTHTLTVTPACVPVNNLSVAWEPATPTVGQVVSMTASATGTAPISFTWQFGDSSNGAGATVTHSYALAGTYTATLYAENRCGLSYVQFSLVVLPVEPEQFFAYLPVILKGTGK